MSDDNLLLEDDLEMESEASDDTEADDEASLFDFLNPLNALPPIMNPGNWNFRRNGQRVNTAPYRSYTRPGVTMYVTRPQFNASMDKIKDDVAKNSRAIQDVNGKVADVTARLASEAALNQRQNRALAKQGAINAKQSKAIMKLRADLKKSQDNALLMTILMKPKTVTLAAADNLGGVNLPAGTRVAAETGKDSSLLLPLLLMSGGDSGSDNNMMFLALALSGAL